jgi:integration host factor subunit beta
MRMVKSALVARLAKRIPELKGGDVVASVDLVIAAIAKALASGGRVEIRDFGAFVVKVRQSKVGRNPRSGQVVAVPARAMPRFRAGKRMRDVVNAKSYPSAGDPSAESVEHC